MPAEPDQLAILKRVTGQLERAGILYMVTGSIASGHYGLPRMTRDIDIVVELRPADSSKLVDALDHEFAADLDMVRRAAERRTMFNVIHQQAIVKVDFVIRKDTDFRREEFGRRRRVDVDGHPLWLVAPEDLILSKLVWAKDSQSELQLRDVRSVLAFQRDTLDRAYLARWASTLSVASLLQEAES